MVSNTKKYELKVVSVTLKKLKWKNVMKKKFWKRHKLVRSCMSRICRQLLNLELKNRAQKSSNQIKQKNNNTSNSKYINNKRSHDSSSDKKSVSSSETPRKKIRLINENCPTVVKLKEVNESSELLSPSKIKKEKETSISSPHKLLNCSVNLGEPSLETELPKRNSISFMTKSGLQVISTRSVTIPKSKSLTSFKSLMCTNQLLKSPKSSDDDSSNSLKIKDHSSSETKVNSTSENSTSIVTTTITTDTTNTSTDMCDTTTTTTSTISDSTTANSNSCDNDSNNNNKENERESLGRDEEAFTHSKLLNENKEIKTEMKTKPSDNEVAVDSSESDGESPNQVNKITMKSLTFTDSSSSSSSSSSSASSSATSASEDENEQEEERDFADSSIDLSSFVACAMETEMKETEETQEIPMFRSQNFQLNCNVRIVAVPLLVRHLTNTFCYQNNISAISGFMIRNELMRMKFTFSSYTYSTYEDQEKNISDDVYIPPPPPEDPFTHSVFASIIKKDRPKNKYLRKLFLKELKASVRDDIIKSTGNKYEHLKNSPPALSYDSSNNLRKFRFLSYSGSNVAVRQKGFLPPSYNGVRPSFTPSNWIRPPNFGQYTAAANVKTIKVGNTYYTTVQKGNGVNPPIYRPVSNPYVNPDTVPTIRPMTGSFKPGFSFIGAPTAASFMPTSRIEMPLFNGAFRQPASNFNNNGVFTPFPNLNGSTLMTPLSVPSTVRFMTPISGSNTVSYFPVGNTIPISRPVLGSAAPFMNSVTNSVTVPTMSPVSGTNTDISTPNTTSGNNISFVILPPGSHRDSFVNNTTRPLVYHPCTPVESQDNSDANPNVVAVRPNDSSANVASFVRCNINDSSNFASHSSSTYPRAVPNASSSVPVPLQPGTTFNNNFSQSVPLEQSLTLQPTIAGQNVISHQSIQTLPNPSHTNNENEPLLNFKRRDSAHSENVADDIFRFEGNGPSPENDDDIEIIENSLYLSPWLKTICDSKEECNGIWFNKYHSGIARPIQRYLTAFLSQGFSTDRPVLLNTIFQMMCCRMCCSAHANLLLNKKEFISELNFLHDSQKSMFSIYETFVPSSIPSLPAYFYKVGQLNIQPNFNMFILKRFVFAIDKVTKVVLYPLPPNCVLKDNDVIEKITVVVLISPKFGLGPGLIIFQHSILGSKLLNSLNYCGKLSDIWSIGAHIKGGLTQSMMTEFLNGDCANFLKSSEIARPGSHLAVDWWWCLELKDLNPVYSKVELVRLNALYSSYKDPIDICISVTMDRIWGKLVRQWKKVHTTLLEHQFPKFILKVLSELCEPVRIQSWCQAAGLYPFHERRSENFHKMVT